MAEVIDNRAERIRRLKEIITGLHQGVPPDEVRRKLKDLVQSTDASEIAAMEQQLIAEGMPTERVMAMCDLHSQVTREILTDRPHAPVLPGHPVDTFRRENEALLQTVGAFRESLAKAEQGEDVAGELRDIYNRLMDVDTHYARKENLLFPILERYGITGPSKVMWGKDDEARALLKGLGEALAVGARGADEWKVLAAGVAEPALRAVVEMVSKENDILLPMALQTFNEVEWAEIYEQTPEFGYCLVEPGDAYRPADREPAQVGPVGGNGALFRAPSGALSREQLAGIFAALPVDLTFVDADDRVRYFTEGRSRVFARPRTILGRKVQHCHPPASVDVVERILSDFRSGREDSCSFWIEFRGRFVYIRYFAVRDGDGTYLGTLEVTQDLTEERGLEGERRLLAYDEATSRPPLTP